jgi:hypothetical protein
MDFGEIPKSIFPSNPDQYLLQYDGKKNPSRRSERD